MPKTCGHPTTDKSLPSYQCQAYCDMMDDLQLVWDVWNELKGCKAKYLPQEQAERAKPYQNRLMRTHFDSRFAPALKGHAGLLSNFSLDESAPRSLLDAAEDIDLQGNSLVTFFTDLDEMVLRDGGAAILVEHPPELVDENGEPLIRSAADQRLYNQRPYLVPIDRRNIPNWDVSYRSGKPHINRVTIREVQWLPDGAFGEEMQIAYRVLTPGRFDVYKLVPSKTDSGWMKVLIPELSGVTDLDYVPLIWYSLSDKNKLFQGAPPFLNMARLNIEHLQKRSSLNEVLHKCNLPVPVRKGLIKSEADLKKGVPPITIGPNSVVDVPTDGDFYFAEPSGAAIASTQADIEKLEGSMDRMSLAFLTGGEGQKTATEVLLDSAQTQATLNGMATRKESTLQQVAQHWNNYTQELRADTQEVPGGEVDESILQAPMEPQAVQQLINMVNATMMTPESALLELKAGKFLSINFDVQAEIRKLEALMKKQSASLAIAPADLSADPAEPPASRPPQQTPPNPQQPEQVAA